jgi:hypothetical protein
MADVYEVYNRCGSCRHFRVSFTDRMGRVMGECGGKPTRPTVGAQEFGCPEYHLDRSRLFPGSVVPADADVSPRERQVQRRIAETRALQASSRRTTERVSTVRVHDDEPERPKAAYIDLDLDTEAGEETTTMKREELRSLLAEVLDEALGISDAPLHPRYKGGKLIVQPGNPDLQAKEVEIDVLFRKIVQIRDRLRVLEQKINSSDKLDATEKAMIQTYITGAYGSLTTFNFLFRDRDDWFVGQDSKS